MFDKSAKLGNVMSMLNLSHIYLYGEGTKKSFETAIEYLTRASELGCSSALNNLGIIYQKKGEHYDLEKAIEYFTKSSEMKDPTAMYNLAYIYQTSNEKLRDIEKAVSLFEQSSKLGNIHSSHHLGLMFEKGNCVERNLNAAINYYRISMMGGDKYCKRRFHSLIRNPDVKWNKELHKYWPKSIFFNDTLLSLLLCFHVLVKEPLPVVAVSHSILRFVCQDERTRFLNEVLGKSKSKSNSNHKKKKQKEPGLH